MVCSKCGHKIKDKEIVCSNCGTFVSESSSYVSSQIVQQGRLQIASARTLGIISIITGIIGIPLIGWICGGNGLSKARSWLFTNDTSLLYDAKKARNLNVAGIIVSTITFIIHFVIAIMSMLGPYAILNTW